MSFNELKAIEIFSSAVQLGSIRKAAAANGLTPQAASHSLQQLEQFLGVRLLHRTTRNLSLTDEGRIFLDAAQSALSILNRAYQRVRSSKDEHTGPIRIIGPRSLLPPLIWKIVDIFCRRHPDIHPDVFLDDRLGNWVQDRLDVGFRIAAQPEEGVVARRLFSLQQIVCASPEYLRRHGIPENIEDLSKHSCSVYRHPETGRLLPWMFKVDGETVYVDLPPLMTTNDAEFEVEAVLSGYAIGQLSNLSATAHIRAGRLVPLLADFVDDSMSVYIYYGSRASQPARVRAFIDLAIETLTDSQEYVLSAQELQDAAS